MKGLLHFANISKNGTDIKNPIKHFQDKEFCENN